MPKYTIYIITHVDNFKIYIFIREIINAAKEEIIILFSIKDLEPIIYYLKLQIERDRQTRIIYFTQITHIDRIFEEIGMQNCRSANISINPKLQL
jgi:hypothetical protein